MKQVSKECILQSAVICCSMYCTVLYNISFTVLYVLDTVHCMYCMICVMCGRNEMTLTGNNLCTN